jgi:thioredoxin reductase (NADPH)
MSNIIIHNVIVIGSGSAGLTASIYLARGLLKPVCVTGYNKLGLLMTTFEVDNFPGFPDGVQGPELMERMYNQAEKFGTEFICQDVVSIDTSKRPFKITLSEGDELLTKSIIIATGSKPIMLGLKNEAKLIGRGISTCAVCDAFFFKDKEVIVVGGGDAAMEEGMYLTKYASKVTIIHRRNEFRASKILHEKAKQNEKIKFMTPFIVKEYLSEKGLLIAVLLENTETKEELCVSCSGCFIFIGHKPNVVFLDNQLELDDHGYIIKKNNTMTSIPGIFTSGDCSDPLYRQAITAAGFGTMSALDCERWLNKNI